MAGFLKYRCEFYSENNTETYEDSRWRIDIYKRTGTPPASPILFKCTSEGFTLNMGGGDDSIESPIKTTTVDFNFIIEGGNTDQEQIISDLLENATNNESEYCLKISRYNATTGSGVWYRYWIGVIVGDLVSLDDDSPNRVIKINAVDGLTQLKYKNYDSILDGGNKSFLEIIKICLSKIASSHTDFGFWDNGTGDEETQKFIIHQPFYYCRAMRNSALTYAWKQDVNKDPLALCKVNTSVFIDKDGNQWSYYKILEQLLSVMHLRIMMTPLISRNTTNWLNLRDGNCAWYLQSPYNYHDNANNSNYEDVNPISQLAFAHSLYDASNNMSNDTALAYGTKYRNTIQDPTPRLAGGKENYIAPLLSYKSIYNHKIFNAIIGGPYSFTSTDHWTTNSPNTSQNTSENVTGLEIPQSSPQTQNPIGFMIASDQISQQKLLITGNVNIKPIDQVLLESGFDGSNYDVTTGVGFNSYNSAEDCWPEMSVPWIYGSYYYIINQPDITIFPRMGIRVKCDFSDDDSYSNSKNFWLGSSRFSLLYGSMPWVNANGNPTAVQNDQYPNNRHGFDGTYAGSPYDMDNPDTTTYEDSYGVPLWGQDVGYEGDYYYWYETDGFENDQWDNPFAWFSPMYTYYSNLAILNTDFISPYGEWNGEMWDDNLLSGMHEHQTAFSVITPFIPWPRDNVSNPINARISNVEFFSSINSDSQLTTDIPYVWHIGCCRDFNHNTPLDHNERGVLFAYSYNDIRIYILGGAAGADSYDQSVGWWQNNNGIPSEEAVQDPELLIGDLPQFNPYALDEDSGAFGGDYPGQIKIYQNANNTGAPQIGAFIDDWKTVHQFGSESENMKLHIKRAKQALAHRYQLKRSLEITLLDRTESVPFGVARRIEAAPFSAIYQWTSGDWATNQAGAEIAFMVTGGSFTAGTGEIKLNLQDCVTYSKSNLEDKSFSSNGS